MLNEEFNVARDLKPVKIMISGPPAAGKSFYSEKINRNYDIPRVHIKEIADKALKMAQTEEEEGPAFDIKTKIDEAKQAAITKIQEDAEAKGIEPPEIDAETFEIPVPDEILYDLLRQRLQENDCRNRGYILDGYPRSHYDCQNIFLKKLIKYDENGEPIEDEGDADDDENAVKSFEGYVKDESIFPSSCIVLEQDDGFLIDRVKNLIEDEVAGSHYNVADMKRRLKKYRQLNESDTAEPSVSQFFADNDIAV